jgi:hypothetical protein
MDLIMSLYGLPAPLVYTVFMLGAAGLAALSCLGLAPLIGPKEPKEHLDLAMRTTGAVTAALTLTLAFCAVQARAQAADAQRLVSAEASAIAGLSRLAHRIGPQGEALAGDIRLYLAQIIAVEFPTMADRGRDPETQRLAEAVENAAYAAAALSTSALADDLLQEVDSVDAAREARLHGATGGLPRPFWILILMLLGLLIAMGPLYPPTRHTALMLAVQTAGVGALIAFVFLMDQPFRSRLGVSPAPYEAALQAMTHRAEGGAAPATLRRREIRSDRSL